MTYEHIDWQAPRPSQAAFAQGWAETRITPLAPLDPRLHAVVAALGATHVNGGACAAQFVVDAGPDVQWVFSRNRMQEYGFFERFFAHPDVRAALPASEGASGQVADFGMANCFVTLGQLAWILAAGGAYVRHAGGDREALDLAMGFAGAAFGDRYSATAAFVNHGCWSPWFHGIAWDASFFWFDHARRIATILMITDTD